MKRLLVIFLLSLCLISCKPDIQGLYKKALDGDEKAEEKLEKLADKKNKEAILAFTEFKIKNKKWDSAIKLLEQAIEVDPENIGTYFKLAKLQSDHFHGSEWGDRNLKSNETYKKILKIKPKDVMLHLKVAYLIDGNENKLEIYKNIIASDPKNVENHFKVAANLSFYQNTDSWSDKNKNRDIWFKYKLDLYKKILELEPKNLSKHLEVEKWLSAMPTHEKDTWFDNYEVENQNIYLQYISDVYKKIIALDPKNVEHYLKLASVQKLNKDKVATYKQLLAINPTNIQVYFELGDLYNEGINNYSGLKEDRHTKENREAKKYYEKILEIDPKNIQAYHKLASLDYFDKKYEDGFKHYEKVTQLYPDSVEAYFNLANQYKWINWYDNKKQREYDEKIEQTLDKILAKQPTIANLGIYNSVLYKYFYKNDYYSSEDKKFQKSINLSKKICDIKIAENDNSESESVDLDYFSNMKIYKNKTLVDNACNRYDKLQKKLRDLKEKESNKENN